MFLVKSITSNQMSTVLLSLISRQKPTKKSTSSMKRLKNRIVSSILEKKEWKIILVNYLYLGSPIMNILSSSSKNRMTSTSNNISKKSLNIKTWWKGFTNTSKVCKCILPNPICTPTMGLETFLKGFQGSPQCMDRYSLCTRTSGSRA